MPHLPANYLNGIVTTKGMDVMHQLVATREKSSETT